MKQIERESERTEKTLFPLVPNGNLETREMPLERDRGAAGIVTDGDFSSVTPSRRDCEIAVPDSFQGNYLSMDENPSPDAAPQNIDPTSEAQLTVQEFNHARHRFDDMAIEACIFFADLVGSTEFKRDRSAIEG